MKKLLVFIAVLAAVLAVVMLNESEAQNGSGSGSYGSIGLGTGGTSGVFSATSPIGITGTTVSLTPGAAFPPMNANALTNMNLQTAATPSLEFSNAAAYSIIPTANSWGLYDFNGNLHLLVVSGVSFFPLGGIGGSFLLINGQAIVTDNNGVQQFDVSNLGVFANLFGGTNIMVGNLTASGGTTPGGVTIPAGVFGQVPMVQGDNQTIAWTNVAAGGGSGSTATNNQAGLGIVIGITNVITNTFAIDTNVVVPVATNIAVGDYTVQFPYTVEFNNGIGGNAGPETNSMKRVFVASESGVLPYVTNWTSGGFVSRASAPDVTTALQNLLNIAGAQGAGYRNVVLLTNGIYHITGSLSIPTNVDIEGVGYAHNTSFGSFMLTGGASMIWADNTNASYVALICTNTGNFWSYLGNLEVCGFTNPLMALPGLDTNVTAYLNGAKWSSGVGVFCAATGTNNASVGGATSGGHHEWHVCVCGFHYGVQVQQNYSSEDQCQAVACDYGYVTLSPINSDQWLFNQCSVGGYFGECGYLLNGNGVVINDPCDIYYEQFLKSTNGSTVIIGGNSEGQTTLAPPYTTNLIELHGAAPSLVLIGGRYALNQDAAISVIDTANVSISVAAPSFSLSGTGFDGLGNPLLVEVRNGNGLELDVSGFCNGNSAWARETFPANGTTHRAWPVGHNKFSVSPDNWLGNTSISTNLVNSQKIMIMQDPSGSGSGFTGDDYPFVTCMRSGFVRPSRLLMCDTDTNSTINALAVMTTNIHVQAVSIGSNLAFPSAGGNVVPAGNYGEVMSNIVAFTSAVNLQTTINTNVCSITLSAGDWNVYGSLIFTNSVATVTAQNAGISLTTGVIPSDGSEVPNDPLLVATSARTSATPAMKPINVSGSTTVYLVGGETFSAGSVKAYGYMMARRVR